MTSYESTASSVSSLHGRVDGKTRARATANPTDAILPDIPQNNIPQMSASANERAGLVLPAGELQNLNIPDSQEPINESTLIRATRRLIDILVSAVALGLFAPLILVIAIMIRIDSPGPALFFQRRLGCDRRRGQRRRKSDDPDTDRRQQEIGHQIWFVKFRTMYQDSRQRFPELYRYTYDDQQLETVRFKVENDPRVTRAGVWLRKSSLDELPNFWNVLTGQMTLVGPRPEIPQMLKYYSASQRLKFKVKPGITGPAQVYGRGLLSFQNTVRLDLSYIRNRNLRYDARIFLKTIQSVVQKDGAF